MSVLTEDDVRRMIAHDEIHEKGHLYLHPKQIITPSAKAYLSEKNITVKKKEDLGDEANSMDPKEEVLFDTLFGAKLTEKPEHMTHLRGNLLVFKDHPRIAFRGAMDSLEAEIIMVQILVEKQGLKKLVKDLEEIIRFVRSLVRCEVSGEPLNEFNLQGLDAPALRAHSHHPSQYYGMHHFLPTYRHGEIVANLNKLRTLTRESELVAYEAFKDEYGQATREDLIRALNRLSSLFWIMMFKYLTDQYKE